MSELSSHVGGRIRLYRRAKKMTLTELAAQIHKSKATLSKYENGEISLDLETLYDIAAVLSIDVRQLLDYTPPTYDMAHAGDFYPQRTLYLYFYDGRIGGINRSQLEIHPDSTPNTVTLFLNIPEIDAVSECGSLYFGTVEYFDTFTNFTFKNQNSRMEQVTLCAANPFDRSSYVLGMLCGISRYPMLPVSIKCILSPTRLTEDEALTEKLLISKRDMKLTRALNMFGVEQS